MSDADSADGGDYGGKGLEEDVDMNEDGDIVDEDGAGVRVPRRRVCFRARSLLVSASVVARYTSMRRVKASAAHLPRQGISDCSIPDMHACAVANVQLGDGPRADFLTVEEADGGGNSDRITTKYMTKYERARILGTRALQLRCVARCARACRVHLRVGGLGVPMGSASRVGAWAAALVAAGISRFCCSIVLLWLLCVSRLPLQHERATNG